MVQNYNVPSAGGDYGAPTPHAAVAAHELFTAPSSSEGFQTGATSTAAFDAMENGLGSASSTSAEASENAPNYDV